MKKKPSTKELLDFFKYIQEELDELAKSRDRLLEIEKKLNSKPSKDLTDEELDEIDLIIEEHKEKARRLVKLIETYLATNAMSQEYGDGLKSIADALKRIYS